MQNWNRINNLLKSFLYGSVFTDSVRSRISRKGIVTEVWTALEAYFHSCSRSRVLEIITQFQNLKQGEMSVDDYMMKTKEVIDHLAAINEPIDDKNPI